MNNKQPEDEGQPQQQQVAPLMHANPFTANTVMVGEARDQEGNARVLLRVEGISGSFLFGLTPKQAMEIGAMLAQEGRRQATGGLTVAKSMPKPRGNGQ